jgi:hypothetical protein
MADIYNQWLKSVNSALRRDRILTDKVKFGPIALKRQLVLNTWNGLLMDEDSLSNDWTLTEGFSGYVANEWYRIIFSRLESHNGKILCVTAPPPGQIHRHDWLKKTSNTSGQTQNASADFVLLFQTLQKKKRTVKKINEVHLHVSSLQHRAFVGGVRWGPADFWWCI